MEKRKPVIAVDLDGVLTNEIKGLPYAKRTPNQSNIKTLQQLHKIGLRIVIFTARYPSDRKITLAWLKKYHVPYHSLVMGKIHYDWIWDDKVFTGVEDVQN